MHANNTQIVLRSQIILLKLHYFFFKKNFLHFFISHFFSTFALISIDFIYQDAQDTRPSRPFSNLRGMELFAVLDRYFYEDKLITQFVQFTEITL